MHTALRIALVVPPQRVRSGFAGPRWSHAGVAAEAEAEAAAHAHGAAQAGRVVGAGCVLAGNPHALQPGQHTLAHEPGAVIRMADEHRGACRGPQHPRLADPAPHERVHERRLARARRAADHREQRRFGGPYTREEVIVELREQLSPGAAGAFSAWQRQRKARGGNPLTQCRERVEQFRPYVQDRHMCRMPNFAALLKCIHG